MALKRMILHYLFDFHFQQTVVFNKTFQYITHYAFTHTCRCAGKDEIADIE